MSKSWIGIRCVRPLIGVLALGLSCVFGLAPAIAADAHTSPEDRARFVSIRRKLEDAPLQPSARADREWALNWLVEAPDISVKACLNPLGGLDKAYPYDGEILLQYMFSMAVLIIEHPEAAKDPD